MKQTVQITILNQTIAHGIFDGSVGLSFANIPQRTVLDAFDFKHRFQPATQAVVSAMVR